MKIRILGNSMRFRIRRSEVDALCTKGYIEDRTNFDTEVLTYVVKSGTNIEEPTGQFKDHIITINLPKSLEINWHGNEQVGFSDLTKFANNSPLSLLLEKEFVCMDERLEDQSNNYSYTKVIL